jgi:hypothetical protein
MAEKRIRHPKLAHCCCLMCQRNHKSDIWRFKEIRDWIILLLRRTQWCVTQQQWVLVLAAAICAETIEAIFPIWTVVLMLFQSIGIENELALRAVILLVSLEAIGCGSGHCVDAWGVCDFCSAMMRFLSRAWAELSALCFQWASKPMMGKILYALRTNDTSILLDSIYMEKDNV